MENHWRRWRYTIILPITLGNRLNAICPAFIDPFFSSGVHLAMTGGISAAASIAASIRGDCSETEAAAWHSKRVSVSYTRYILYVLFAGCFF